MRGDYALYGMTASTSALCLARDRDMSLGSPNLGRTEEGVCEELPPIMPREVGGSLVRGIVTHSPWGVIVPVNITKNDTT